MDWTLRSETMSDECLAVAHLYLELFVRVCSSRATGIRRRWYT